MRINEITNNTVNEGVLSSIGSGLKTAASAVGSAVSGVADVAGRGIMQKYGGTTGGTYGPALSGSAAQTAAGQMTGPLIKKMGQEMQKQWLTQALPALMKASNSTEAAQVHPADQIEELTKLINGNLKFDYTKPNVSSAAQNGRAKTEADQRIREIDNAIRSIVTHPAPGSGNAKSTQEYVTGFTELANAMAALMNLTQFQGGGAQVGGVQDPVANKAMIALGVSPAELDKFRAIIAQPGVVAKPTGNPRLDAFLHAAKII